MHGSSQKGDERCKFGRVIAAYSEIPLSRQQLVLSDMTTMQREGERERERRGRRGKKEEREIERERERERERDVTDTIFSRLPDSITDIKISKLSLLLAEYWFFPLNIVKLIGYQTEVSEKKIEIYRRKLDISTGDWRQISPWQFRNSIDFICHFTRIDKLSRSFRFTRISHWQARSDNLSGAFVTRVPSREFVHPRLIFDTEKFHPETRRACCRVDKAGLKAAWNGLTDNYTTGKIADKANDDVSRGKKRPSNRKRSRTACKGNINVRT